LRNMVTGRHEGAKPWAPPSCFRNFSISNNAFDGPIRKKTAAQCLLSIQASTVGEMSGVRYDETGHRYIQEIRLGYVRLIYVRLTFKGSIIYNFRNLLPSLILSSKFTGIFRVKICKFDFFE